MNRLILAGLMSLASALGQPRYTKTGEFVLPKDFRTWPFLSSGIGMTYSNTHLQNPRFSNVFVDPAALKVFLKKGVWPDKTILITEDRNSGNHLSNPEGRFQTD